MVTTPTHFNVSSCEAAPRDLQKKRKCLATQLDDGQGLTAREMAVLLNLDLIKGNAAHAAKVKSRVWMAWHRNKDKRDRQAG